MNNKQILTVVVLVAVSLSVAVYNRTTEAENIPAAVETSYKEKTPDFKNMKVLKEYTVAGKDIKIRVVDNETLTTFGPGRVAIYKNNERICEKWIGNDGGTLYDFNVDIKNDRENVYVTLKGCEQEDEIVTLPIN